MVRLPVVSFDVGCWMLDVRFVLPVIRPPIINLLFLIDLVLFNAKLLTVAENISIKYALVMNEFRIL